MGCLIMKKKTLLLALIPALLLAPSCSATKNTGGMKADDVVIRNENTNDKYGDSPVMLKADRHNAVNTAASDDVAVSTTEEGDNLILSFAVSEALATELIATGNNEVSVYYGYVPYEYDAVDNATVKALGEKIDYDLSLGRVIRLIIKDRGTADYADKKYQGVLVYERNSEQYVSETQSISQTWEMIEEDVTDNLLAYHNSTLSIETNEQYGNSKTYKVVTKSLTGKAVYSHMNLPLPTLKGNFSGAKISFALKTDNVKSSSLFLRLTDSTYTKLPDVGDATCKADSPSAGVLAEPLEGDWYKYTVNCSLAFAGLQTNQMLSAFAAQLVFSNDDVNQAAVTYISQITLTRPNKASLAAPVITMSGSTITWGNVKNASGYTVYKDDVEQATFNTVDELTYTDTDEKVGARVIKVVAHTDGKGYFFESSASVIHKVIDETAESGDLSNNLLKVSNVTITQNDDATYNGAWSQKITGTKDSMCMKLMAKDLGGITGKTLTFYTQMVDASAVASGYLHVTFNYFDSSYTKLGQEPNHYLCFNTNHAASLGTFEKLSGTNWMRSTIKLDDKLFGSVNPEEVSYLRIKINEQCIINFDAMSVTDTQAV